MAATNYTYSIDNDFPNRQVDSDSLTTQINASSIGSAALLYIETTGDDCDIWFDGPLSSGDQTTLDGIVAAHTGEPELEIAHAGVIIGPLATPNAPSVTPQGASGSTAWGYKITAFSQSGETMASSEGQTSTGAAVLSAINFNRLTWKAVPGATKYGIYRVSAGGSPATTGKVAETTNARFDDTGQAASGAEPSEDRSGSVIIGDSSAVNAASKVLDLVETTTDDSTVTSLLSILRKSTNTVLAGFGTGIYVRLNDDTDVVRAAGALHFLWDDPDSADLDCDFRVMLRDGGSALVERFRVKADGSLVIDGTTVIDEATCVDTLPVNAGVKGGTTSASSNNDIAAVRFDTGGDGWNRFNIKPPARYTNGDLKFRLHCSVPSTVAASKGTRWKLSWACLGLGDSLPSSWPYSDEFTYDISGQAIDQLFAIDFTIPAAQFDKTKDMMAIRMDRIGTDLADDCGVHIYVHGLEVRYTGFRYAGQ
jgi:hypothetical protein